MPGGAKQDAITLTFSKKNKDVYDKLRKIIEDKKNNGSGVNATDYICNAVRFFEEYHKGQSSSRSVDYREVERLVEEKISEFKRQLLNSDIDIPKETKDAANNETASDNAYLEDNLDNIPIEDD
jgi:hypothetical protein